MIAVTWHAPLLDSASLTNVQCQGEVGFFFPNVMTDLQAIPASLCNKYAFLKGYTTVNDGFGGEFYWARESTESDDAVTVINPSGNTGPGRWIKRL